MGFTGPAGEFSGSKFFLILLTEKFRICWLTGEPFHP